MTFLFSVNSIHVYTLNTTKGHVHLLTLFIILYASVNYFLRAYSDVIFTLCFSNHVLTLSCHFFLNKYLLVYLQLLSSLNLQTEAERCILFCQRNCDYFWRLNTSSLIGVSDHSWSSFHVCCASLALACLVLRLTIFMFFPALSWLVLPGLLMGVAPQTLSIQWRKQSWTDRNLHGNLHGAEKRYRICR